MNARILLGLSLFVILAGCSRTKEEVIEAYRGKGNVILAEECLLFEGRLDYLGAPHQFILYTKTDSNSWRRRGWVSAGTRLTVTSLRRTVHPEKGETLYFVGQVESAEEALREFVYVSEDRSASKAKIEVPWKWNKSLSAPGDESSAPQGQAPRR